MPEGEEQQQEIENLFEQIRKISQSGEGNRLPGSPESPKEVGPKEEHTKAHHQVTQDRRERENLKSSKRKKEISLQRSAHKTIS